MSRNLRLEIAYDGTDFHGWQIQPHLDTIQGQLTHVIERIVQAPVQVHGSGRTDAGAHALAQICSFKSESLLPLPNFRKAINSLLPPAIRVNSIEEASENFHARFDASGSTIGIVSRFTGLFAIRLPFCAPRSPSA